MSASSPWPSSASAAICRSSATAWRSSSARRFTTAPINVRSSTAASVFGSSKHGRRIAVAEFTRSPTAVRSLELAPDPVRRITPVARWSTRYSISSRRAGASVALVIKVASGISARSPASIPSNAGIRARITRTQVTVCASASSGAAVSCSAPGRSVLTISRSDAISVILLR